MKVAEALVRIKDLKGKCAELQRTILSDAQYELVDPELPMPDLSVTIDALVVVSSTLSDLKVRVAKTNAQYRLVDKIHEMEHLRSCVAKLEHLTTAKQVSARLEGWGNEPKEKVYVHATYNVEEVRDQVTEYRQKIRKLDLELQRLNWEVDLVD